jgi:hypothetical protein
VTGSSPGKGGDSDFETIAYDAATGSELWAKRFDGAAGLDDSSGSLTVSPDGSSVFVPGLTFAATNDTDWVTLAYDASTGAKLWKREFDGPGTSLSQDGPSAISATPDGSAVFVTGESQGPSQGTDLKTIGYDATTGSKLWGSALTSDGQDNGFAVIVSPDSSAVFVTGYGYNNATGFVDALTVGYDAGTGAEIWAKHFNGPDHLGGSAYEISVSSDGASIFVTGSVQRQATVSDYVTISYDTADGSKLWSRLYDGPGNAVDGANDLTLTSDGATVIVTGRSEDRPPPTTRRWRTTRRQVPRRGSDATTDQRTTTTSRRRSEQAPMGYRSSYPGRARTSRGTVTSSPWRTRSRRARSSG